MKPFWYEFFHQTQKMELEIELRLLNYSRLTCESRHSWPLKKNFLICCINLKYTMKSFYLKWTQLNVNDQNE